MCSGSPVVETLEWLTGRVGSKDEARPVVCPDEVHAPTLLMVRFVAVAMCIDGPVNKETRDALCFPFWLICSSETTSTV